MINVMFFLGFPPVAQYVAQGLIIVGAVALPQIRWRRAMSDDRDQAARDPAAPGWCWPGWWWSPCGSPPASLTRGFGAYGHLRYLLELAAVIGLVAAGQTLVVIGGGIDLSVGAVITVTAILLPLLSRPGTRPGSSGWRRRCWSPPASGSSTALGIAAAEGASDDHDPGHGDLLQGLLVIVAGGSAITVQQPGGGMARLGPPGRRAGRHPVVAGGLGRGAGAAAPHRGGRADLRPRRQPAGGALSGVDIGRDHGARSIR